jgi:hypothetical protein
LIEAVRWKGENKTEVNAFVKVPTEFQNRQCVIHYDSLLRAEPGDWIIRHWDGRYETMTDIVFNHNYQLFSVRS